MLCNYLCDGPRGWKSIDFNGFSNGRAVGLWGARAQLEMSEELSIDTALRGGWWRQQRAMCKGK